ncbi:DUF503 domain-containing protein [Desmospora profundinema]|uniref:Uncharacterized protein YlxP (DUF503 family) n=1 Tax=Desmospora profundinema TaxID=1571184 RepID=A0ABU1IHG9_9BACL|nr:DUF503 domain-containing protein [Desmospora profundinema]MDR6224216.1 uncharacterized protein YlxP (DUF503 family) [Desmospora profundinema]
MSKIVVGLLECRCRVWGSTSLKDKRRAVKSGLSRVRGRLGLSAAEVGEQDDRQWAQVAVTAVSNTRVLVEKELKAALHLLEEVEGLEIIDAEITYL